MVVFLIRAYYTLIVYLCQEHCGANCGRIFASYGGFATVFSSLSYHNQRTKKKKYETSSFFVYGADYETRSARFCARRHAPDRRTVPRTVLCFATVFSSLSYHNRKIKKEAMNASFLFLERITRLARLAFALADTHPTDEQSPGLFFASQRSFRVSHTTTKEQKKKKYKTSSFFVMERITRLELATFTLAR